MNVYFIKLRGHSSCRLGIYNANLCCRASDRRRERTALDVGTREVPVLRTSTIVALAGQTKDAQMPISTVRRSARREGSGRLNKRVVTGGMPEGDLV